MRTPTLTKELEFAIDAVVESYADESVINNLESAALPNRRAVIEAFLHMTPVMFMGVLQHARAQSGEPPTLDQRAPVSRS